MGVKNTHGGANRGQGRKPRPLPKWLAVVRCSADDWQIIQTISPEQRAEIIIAWAQANTVCSGLATPQSDGDTAQNASR